MDSVGSQSLAPTSVSAFAVIVRQKFFKVASLATDSEDAAENRRLRRGIAKPVKALDFDSSIRRFESFFPCH